MQANGLFHRIPDCFDMSSNETYQKLQARLDEALAECARLRAENQKLREALGSTQNETGLNETPRKYTSDQSPLEVSPSQAAKVHSKSSSTEKIALFRKLFRGREDVYPKLWENRKGDSGYTPACANEWKRPLCGKPKVKCAQCENRSLVPLSDQVIYDHLSGKQTIGVYPLLKDETCWFLAADFDKELWREDASIFRDVCRKMGVPTALERSRSGNGGHVWIFFQAPVPAATARRLGYSILAQAIDRMQDCKLYSYDRFFPNQDTLPKGGFGNLIALPLQYSPRSQGNSIFLDDTFQPVKDQWAFLAGIERMRPEDVEILAKEAMRQGTFAGVQKSQADDYAEDPWTLPPSKKKKEQPILDPLPAEVELVKGNLLYVHKKYLPSVLYNRLSRLAAFQNPEFYKAQAMRLSTYKKPRIIFCSEDFSHYLCLPRGCLDDVLEMLRSLGIHSKITDKRYAGNLVETLFHGELTPLQKQAAETLLKDDCGVLCATTAFGKTVVGAWLIARRQTNTLILVHRRQLMDQWHERLQNFLDLPSIGRFGGGKDQRTGLVDIAMLQSLNRKGVVQDKVADYGQIIVDECHHLSAFRFEQVMRQVKAKYVCGLTATPSRKDGHHPIIYMQCGPIRFRVDPKSQAAVSPFEQIVVPRRTSFTYPHGNENVRIQDIYAALSADEKRNEMIQDDILRALDQGRSPLLLAERTTQVQYFEKRLQNFVRNIIVLQGGMGKKKRQAVAEKLKAIPDTEERLLIATGRYIGEGFDDARLDTLFMVSPLSWRGTLQQYAGRLHRLHHHKHKVIIYDYVDEQVPQLARMFSKRLAGYRAMGYTVEEDGEVKGD